MHCLVKLWIKKGGAMQAWYGDAAIKGHFVSVARKIEKAKGFKQGLYGGGDGSSATNMACWRDHPSQG
jgi:hypothetical protein